MKSFLTGLIIGALICGAAIWRFHGGAAEEDHAAAEEKPKDFVEHAKDGTVSVKIEDEVAKQMGLRTAEVKAASIKAETKAYGRVLNTPELPLLLAEVNVAELAARGSKKAFDRLKKLNGEAGSVSEQKVEEADEAVKKDEVALQTAKVKLVTTWGQAVAERNDLPELARQISANEVALVRLDLAPGESAKATSAKVALPGAEDQSTPAEVLGPAPQADPVTQSASLICLVRAKGWVPGAAVVGWLGGESEPAAGVSVPREALLRHEGMAFAYVKHEEEFKRVPVTLARELGDSWLVTQGLKEGDEVVIAGAQQLLSEELKGQSQPD